ncbi:bifunctional DNA primase/polymerase [Saccharopolyspora indica]|uniref:bifunctional DNA primase/polymerase n=1 Tax=Saccharopolyspora indica TaxID=1229659 RepID=UPI0022EA3F92|nr:bifunctional DNA primase/polymerase [Saccharopolyspora indica]MDA3644378.1 bifunctional DNA primase/polymerase [Saccharopolyspora indica]
MSSPSPTDIAAAAEVTPPRLLKAALDATAAGHAVIPLRPGAKAAAVSAWEQAATRDETQIRRWWAQAPFNIGIATGPSGLHVIDLDDGHGQPPPQDFAGARGGQDVLARLAAAAGQPFPDTFTVDTPRGGSHLYFAVPPESELRCTVGRLGWRVDSRGHGGYVVAAGSVLAGEGLYVVRHAAPIAALPDWLVEGLTPPPAPEPAELALPSARASAYVRAVVERETTAVALAGTGTRHHTLLRAAGSLGRLVSGGELDEPTAAAALQQAAARHIGVDDFTAAEAERTIRDGLRWGSQHPRTITRT